MKCKKHVTDLSSLVGVCASCLRERLFFLIAAQEQAQAALQQSTAAAQNDHRKSEAVPPPLAFPRSVSPYISRRKSDTNSAVWDDPRHQKAHPNLNGLPDRRFYSTPQVGPNGTLVAGDPYSKKKTRIRFSLFGYLFRSKSDKLDLRPSYQDSGPVMDSAESCVWPAPSPSWFSSILPGQRKKQSRTFSLEESTSGLGQRRVVGRNLDRGMSPVRYSDDEDEHYNNASSGYSSESSQPWKQTPRRTPAAALQPGKKSGSVGGGGRQGHSRNVSGMTFCLSPLVRASPGRHWSKKGVPPEMVVAGDIRVVPVKPALTNALSFSKNRSRKLADFGRFHQNR